METFRRTLVAALVLTFFSHFGSCEGPEQGIFEVKLYEDNWYGAVSKSLKAGTEIGISVNCTDGGTFRIEWIVRYTKCSELSPDQIVNSSKFIENLFSGDGQEGSLLTSESFVSVQKSNASNEMSCANPSILKDETEPPNWSCYTTDVEEMLHCSFLGEYPTKAPTKAPDATPAKGAAEAPANGKAPAEAPANGKAPAEAPANGKAPAEAPAKANTPVEAPSAADKPSGKQDTGKAKRAAGKEPAQKAPAATTTPKNDTEAAKATTEVHKKKLKHRVTQTNKKSGRFWVLVHLQPVGETKPKSKLEVTVTIKMRSPSGYLSASQTPLLVFYGVMCGAYSVLTLIWLLMLAFQWQDLLRIQYWIGAVMLLGLLEKAVFYAEYENINNNGRSMAGAIIFAELISCLKRALARMLVVIVSLGYGITRPRLGRDLHWVLGAGMAFFIMSSIEACLRVKGTEQHAVIAIFPLAVLDAIICWWVFRSLVDTTRTLRLRRNMVKLWLYRHFTNTLIFCVLAAVVFLLWSFKTHHWTNCIQKWHELWLDDAYWHVLFCVILVVIVILFRPTANNQRYAFSPLTDRDEDDESKEPMMNDAFEGMKMRNVITNRNDSQSSHKMDDDLKWVEDNIPASVADAALGALVDSDEELVTNLERSKME